MTGYVALLQAASTGIAVDPAWVVTTISTVVGSLCAAILFIDRGRTTAMERHITWLESENKTKDAKIDQLIAQVGRLAEAADHSIANAEKGRGYR